MRNDKDYQANYWAGGKDFDYLSHKPKRSIKKKLSIVFSFVFVLAVTPSLIYAFMNLDLDKDRGANLASNQIQTPANLQNNTAPEIHKVYIEEPKPAENETTVVNNDSYWKITKRVCGKGNNYLFVKEQNGGKALYEGDSVTVNCEL